MSMSKDWTWLTFPVVSQWSASRLMLIDPWAMEHLQTASEPHQLDQSKHEAKMNPISFMKCGKAIWNRKHLSANVQSAHVISPILDPSTTTHLDLCRTCRQSNPWPNTVGCFRFTLGTRISRYLPEPPYNAIFTFWRRTYFSPSSSNHRRHDSRQIIGRWMRWPVSSAVSQHVPVTWKGAVALR